MKLILTSFGLTQEPEDSLKDKSLFYRMPPVNMRRINNTFMPEYAALLLCEKVILDESSFTALQEEPHWSYAVVAEALKSLYAEGFVELADFNHILSDNKALLERMLEYDLKILDQWIVPLKESVDIWFDFAMRARMLMEQDLRGHLPPTRAPFRRHMDRTNLEVYDALSGALHLYGPYGNEIHWLVSEALESSRKRRKAEYRDALKETLRSYLSHVNANIILSNEVGTGFHDWVDFLPFYRRKFLAVGREDLQAEQHIEASQSLFEVSFPEFTISDMATLIRVLRDKRVADLRRLVQDAVEGRVTFDEEFARSVFKEVLGVERQVARYRKIISYLTMPLDFIPWVGTFAQKATEEVAEMVVDRKLKQKYRWFYLLSDVVEESRESSKVC